MTQRERFSRTLNHQLPDRTPTQMSARAEVVRGLCDHFDEDANGVYERLGIERPGGIGFGINFPDYASRVNGVLSGDCPYAGGKFIFHAPDVFEDSWGVVRRKGQDGKYVEWVRGPLSDAQSVDEYDFPGTDRIVDNPGAATQVEQMKAAGRWVQGGVAMPFKTAWELRGLEQTLVDYLLHRDFLEELYDRIFALNTEMCRQLATAGVDMITVVGDISMQDRLMMHPQSWREVDKPRLAFMIAESRRIKPDVHFFIHSDGDLREILPDLIEIGFDVINPVQPECMDPAELKLLYGDQITLHGTGSIQQTLPFGSVVDVRREVEHRIETCGYNGGLVLQPSNVIPYDTPLENVIAFFETARDYDLSAFASSAR